MTGPLAGPGMGQGPAGAGTEGPLHAKLHAAARQLEGVFMAQLFQAMRKSVPNDAGGAGPGGEMFTQMLDEQLANAAALHRTGSIGDRLYRQLARRLPEGA